MLWKMQIKEEIIEDTKIQINLNSHFFDCIDFKRLSNELNQFLSFFFSLLIMSVFIISVIAFFGITWKHWKFLFSERAVNQTISTSKSSLLNSHRIKSIIFVHYWQKLAAVHVFRNAKFSIALSDKSYASAPRHSYSSIVTTIIS